MSLTVKDSVTTPFLAPVHTLAYPAMLYHFILSNLRRSGDSLRSHEPQHTLATHIHRLLMHHTLARIELFATSLAPLLHTSLQHLAPLLQCLQLADDS